jgi:hypothetical protein
MRCVAAADEKQILCCAQDANHKDDSSSIKYIDVK